MDELISIISPTYKGNPQKINRCVQSVIRQTYTNFEQIFCSDGMYEMQTANLIESLKDKRISYMVTEKHHGGYGAAVRQEVMMNRAKGKYLVHLDDDNIIFPFYLERMLKKLIESPEAKFVISEVLHFGPVQPFVGTPPLVLRGDPQLYFIDTIQVMIETETMKKVGWVSNDYCADGQTYEALGKQFKFVRVPECLSAHL